MNNPLSENTTVMMEAIEDCLEKRRLLPCLALFYTTLDVMASLERIQSEGTQAAFVRWADKYFLKVRSLPCNATDLYAARCAVLHTFTAESDLSRRGRARVLFYAWGNSAAEDLDQTAALLDRGDVISVHVRDLIDALRGGIAEYIRELGADISRQPVVAQRAGLWFTNMQPEVVRQFLESHVSTRPAS
jgi:hypothetical protein